MQTPMNWDQWRSELALDPEIVHFNHAGVSPISRRVADTINRFAADAARFTPDRMREWYWRAEEVRDRFARLIGAHGDEIAFVKNTSEGISLVAAGLPWRTGDNVLALDGEYPANVYPWWGLRRWGVETRMLTNRGPVTVDQLRALADDRTRVVAVSFVDWSGGGRTDLAAIGEWCRSRDILLCVDGIQGVGALQLDVEGSGIDCLAVGGHKWLLAPEGCGCLYVSRRVVDRIDSLLLGWKSVSDADNYLPYHFELRRDAAKFEPGTAAILGTVALGSAIDLLLEIGVAQVEARLRELTDRLAEGVRALGGEVLSPWEPQQRSGIVIVRTGEDPTQLYDRLVKAGFILRMRGGGIRVAPHFYTSNENIDRFLDALRARG